MVKKVKLDRSSPHIFTHIVKQKNQIHVNSLTLMATPCIGGWKGRINKKDTVPTQHELWRVYGRKA